MTVRPDPNRCLNGHDLTLPGATRQTDDGTYACRACQRDRVNRLRRERRKRGVPPRKSTRPRGKSEPQMSPAEVEAHFARMRRDETAAAWDKPKRMWPDQDEQGPASQLRAAEPTRPHDPHR